MVAAIACGSSGESHEPGGCGAILAAGVVYGRRLPSGDFDGQTAVILRLEDDEWTYASLPTTAGGEPLRTLGGVRFSAAARQAWAWGGGGERRGIALRSTDAGRSWVDVSHLLPIALQAAVGGARLLDQWFPTATRGWIATTGFFFVGQATLYATADGGGSWDERPGVGGLHATGTGIFGARKEKVEIMLAGAGTRIVRIDDGIIEVVDGVIGRDYATWGGRGWIAGETDASSARVPAVYSAEIDHPWTPQPLPPVGEVGLETIDVADGSSAVTCGRVERAGGEEPICLWTLDGGETWRVSDLPQLGAPFGVAHVVRCPGSTAWAVAEELGPGSRITFLRSIDSGASWLPVAVAGGGAGRIRSLARERVRER
jgi:hypothetical protein